MSWWDNILEVLSFRQSGNIRAGTVGGSIAVRDTAKLTYDGLFDTGDINLILTDIRNLARDRESLFALYEEMSDHPIIGAALELYADDSTQPDVERNRRVWIESNDPQLQRDLNDFLEGMEVENRVWGWAYSLAKFGDVYLRTYHSDFIDSGELEVKPKENVEKSDDTREPVDTPVGQGISDLVTDSRSAGTKLGITEARQLGLHVTPGCIFEDVTDLASIFDLQLFGKTIGFFEQMTNNANTASSGAGLAKNTAGQTVAGYLTTSMDFIHFSSAHQTRRSATKLNLPDFSGKKAEIVSPESISSPRELQYSYGTSIIEGSRKAYKTLVVLEDAMVTARLSRSATVRMVGINVGDAEGAESVRIVREIKNAFKSKESIQSDGSYRSDSSPIPLSGNLFYPTHNGKGEITISEMGGQTDVKAIVDFETFQSRLFATLRVPKPYLGFDEHLPGSLGNTSLTRLDIRYCRSVKRISEALLSGITKMCTYYLRVNGKLTNKTKFEVRMRPINDAEESDRINDIMTRVQAADSLVNMINNLAGSLEFFDFVELLRYLCHITGIDAHGVLQDDRTLKLLAQRRAKTAATAAAAGTDLGGFGMDPMSVGMPPPAPDMGGMPAALTEPATTPTDPLAVGGDGFTATPSIPAADTEPLTPKTGGKV